MDFQNAEHSKRQLQKMALMHANTGAVGVQYLTRGSCSSFKEIQFLSGASSLLLVSLYLQSCESVSRIVRLSDPNPKRRRKVPKHYLAYYISLIAGVGHFFSHAAQQHQQESQDMRQYLSFALGGWWTDELLIAPEVVEFSHYNGETPLYNLLSTPSDLL